MAVVIVLSILETVCIILAMYNPAFKKHSLLSKMLCSFLFVSVGIAAVIYSGEIGKYSWRVLAGLLLGFLGDYLLEKKRTFLIGSVCFALGHIFYIGAFIRGFDRSLYKYPLFLAAFAAVYIAYVALAKKSGVLFRGRFYPLALYSIALVLMCVAALSRAVLLAMGGNYALAAFISAGSLLFVFSDTCLALDMFGTKNNFVSGKKVHLSYFPAQTLIALSILFS